MSQCSKPRNKTSAIGLHLHSVINHSRPRHSCESRNPEKTWIPGQARNDKLHKKCVVYVYIVSVIRIPEPVKNRSLLLDIVSNFDIRILNILIERRVMAPFRSLPHTTSSTGCR